MLLSAAETALTRAAGDGRRQPHRGGRVHTHPRVVSRIIPAKGRPGFRAVSAMGIDGRENSGESGWGLSRDLRRWQRHLVWDTRRRAQRLPTAAERIALIRDVAVFCVTRYTQGSALSRCR